MTTNDQKNVYQKMRNVLKRMQKQFSYSFEFFRSTKFSFQVLSRFFGKKNQRNIKFVGYRKRTIFYIHLILWI